MAEKKSSIIKTVREGKKISILQKLNPLNWPGIFIGKFLKTQDSIKAFNKTVVQDKASGKPLSWYVDLYSMFNPLLEFKAFRLRRKNQRDSFKEKIKQSIINNKQLTWKEQFAVEFLSSIPFIGKDIRKTIKEAHQVKRHPSKPPESKKDARKRRFPHFPVPRLGKPNSSAKKEHSPKDKDKTR